MVSSPRISTGQEIRGVKPLLSPKARQATASTGTMRGEAGLPRRVTESPQLGGPGSGLEHDACRRVGMIFPLTSIQKLKTMVVNGK